MRIIENGDIGAAQHSDWLAVDQALIDAFAETTGDRQFIHVDPARAAFTPFGGTIAHGLLLLSLVPRLFAGLRWRSVDSDRIGVNYGFDRVRFISPVRSGSRIRLAAALASSEEKQPGQIQHRFDLLLELEGGQRPAMSAAWIIQLMS